MDIVVVDNAGTVKAWLEPHDLSITLRLNGYAELHGRIPITDPAGAELNVSSRAIKAYRNGELVFHGRIGEPLTDDEEWTTVVAYDPFYWLKARAVHNPYGHNTYTYKTDAGSIAKKLIDDAQAGVPGWPATDNNYSRVQTQAVNSNASDVTSISATLPGAPTEGNLLVACVDISQSGSSASLNTPAGWTQVPVDSPADNAGSIKTAMFYKVAGTAESATLTVTTPSSARKMAMVVMEYAAGNGGTWTLDVHSKATPTGALSPGMGNAGPTTVASALAVTVFGAQSSSSVSSVSNGFAVVRNLPSDATGTGRVSIATADKVLTAIGTVSGNATSTLSTNWANIVAVFYAIPPQLRDVNAFVRTNTAWIGTANAASNTFTTSQALVTTSGRVYVVFVANRAHVDSTPTLIGAGLTWTQRGTRLMTSGAGRVTMFTATGDGGVGGPLTASFTGDADQVWIAVHEATNVSTSSPVVQFVGKDDNRAHSSPATLTMAAFGSGNNAAVVGLYVFGRAATFSVTEAGWKSINRFSSEQGRGGDVRWKVNDPSVSINFSPGDNWQVGGVELRALGGTASVTGKFAQFFGTSTNLGYETRQFRPVADVISELANLSDGFYFRMVPVDHVAGKHADFHVYYPDAGVDRPEVRFEYGETTLNNLEGFSRESRYPFQEGYAATDSNGAFVDVSALSEARPQGEYGFQDILVQPAQDTAESMYPAVVGASLRVEPVKVYSIKPAYGSDNVPKPWVDFAVGDVVRLSVVHGRVNDTGLSARINEVTVSIDDDGVESVEGVVLEVV